MPPAQDTPSQAQAMEIARQMREEGKSYSDFWEEYHTGTSIDYSCDRDEKKFKKVEIDVIVGSFCNTSWLAEDGLIEEVSRCSLFQLRKAGFRI